MLPDTMAWATFGVENSYVDAAGSNGDAVISDSNCGRSDVDVGGVTDVDAVGVGAVPGGCNVDAMDSDIVTVYDGHMESLTIL